VFYDSDSMKEILKGNNQVESMFSISAHAFGKTHAIIGDIFVGKYIN